MLPITPVDLRAAFVNASRKEVTSITLPDWFDDADWASLDYLGWRDPKIARRAYVVAPTLDGEHVGIVLRRADAAPRARAQCSWCQDVRLPNDVVFYSAKLAGAAGRRLDDASPYVDARLPGSGVRLHAVLAPVAADGTCLSLRVLRPARHDLAAVPDELDRVVGLLEPLLRVHEIDGEQIDALARPLAASAFPAFVRYRVTTAVRTA